jgi:hypothetical protein
MHRRFASPFLRRAALAAFTLVLGCAGSGSNARLADLDRRVQALEEQNRELAAQREAETARFAKGRDLPAAVHEPAAAAARAGSGVDVLGAD